MRRRKGEGDLEVKDPDLLRSSSPKKTMLNIEASSVAGRKMAPSSEMVFIDVLSRLLACASRRWSAAIWRLSLDSFWAMMLYNYSGHVSLGLEC